MIAIQNDLHQVANNILTITLNQPHKLNAGATHVMPDLIDAFDRVDVDNEG